MGSPPTARMSATLIDGKAAADAVREELRARVAQLTARAGRAPGLAVVLVLVGAKMLVAAAWTAPAWLTLVIVALVLGGAVVASLVKNRTPEGIHDAR